VKGREGRKETISQPRQLQNDLFSSPLFFFSLLHLLFSSLKKKRRGAVKRGRGKETILQFRQLQNASFSFSSSLFSSSLLLLFKGKSKRTKKNKTKKNHHTVLVAPLNHSLTHLDLIAKWCGDGCAVLLRPVCTSCSLTCN